jgi:hypothetical protein
MYDRYRERPRCRKQIIAHRLSPYLLDTGKWNGFSSRNPEGKQVFLSSSMKTQMRKMLAEGFWDETGFGKAL